MSNPSNYQSPRLNFILQNLQGVKIAESGQIEIPYEPISHWTKIAFTFDVPFGSQSLQLIIRNENGGAIGNDFGIDDIVFAPCLPNVVASFSNNLTSFVTVAENCNTGTNTLHALWPNNIIPVNQPNFQWQRKVDGSQTWQDIVGATTAIYSYSESVSNIYYYRVKVIDGLNPTIFYISNELIFYVQKMYINPVNVNAFTCQPTLPSLNASYSLGFSDPNNQNNNISYLWTPSTYLSSTTVPNPTLNLPPLTNNNPSATPPPPVTYTYNLTVSNTRFSGCSTTNLYTLTRYNPRTVAVPNIFTPNGDGTNDTWRPINIEDYPGARAEVWNRYGQLIFSSNGPTIASYSWDGKFNGVNQPIDTYVWKVIIPGCPTNILSQGNLPNGTLILAR